MKTGVLITARLGSTRLKRKHMLPVLAKPLLYYLIRRVSHEFQAEVSHGSLEIIIATSDEAENREFEVLNPLGVKVFYGSRNNIPLRHLQAALAHGLDCIIAVDGDDILCSVQGMRCVYKAVNDGQRYVKTSFLPFGMNSFGYSREFLEASLRPHIEDTLETGWGRIFDAEVLTDLALSFAVPDKSMRFTLDYEEDYHFFKALISALGARIDTASDEEIIRVATDQELFKFTELVAQEYWANYYKEIEAEKQLSDST